MSLLELITKASANPQPLTSQSNYPIILNPDPILLSLKPEHDGPINTSLIKPVKGWKISQTDSEIIQLNTKFFKKLKRQLKNPNNFSRDEFIVTLNSFLEKNRDKVGIFIGVDPSDLGYTRVMIEKLGFLMGRDVASLVLEVCIVLEIWELLETLIVYGLVEHSCYSNLVTSLIDKKRSDLLCLCIKHVSNIRSFDLLCIVKYFLSTPIEGYSTMVTVRKEWESQALLAIEKATDKSLTGKKLRLAKEASVLLMVAHDGFSVSEMCLHYLLASSNVDEMILSFCISKLNGSEMMSLIQYLGKWLKKYERFPQSGPCPKASSMLGLKACEWVPTLEDVVKWLGLVLDEHFSSLVLHPEFHEELGSTEGVVRSLALEARLCCSVANVVENLRAEVEGCQSPFGSKGA